MAQLPTDIDKLAALKDILAQAKPGMGIAWYRGTNWPDDEPTISELLTRQGFETSGVGSTARKAIPKWMSAVEEVYDVKVRQEARGHLPTYWLEYGMDFPKTAMLAGMLKGASTLSERDIAVVADEVLSHARPSDAKRIREIFDLPSSCENEDNNKGSENTAANNQVLRKTYENIMKLAEAIEQKVLVSFNYGHWNFNGNLELVVDESSNPKRYVRIPARILFDNGHYYAAMLRPGDSNTESFATFRIDRMANIELEGESFRDNHAALEAIDKSARWSFAMFGSHETSRLTLAVHKSAVDGVIDHIGHDITFNSLTKKEAESCLVEKSELDEFEHGEWMKVSFEAHAGSKGRAINVSPTLIGWIAGFDTCVRVLKPKWFVDYYRDYLKKLVRTVPDN